MASGCLFIIPTPANKLTVLVTIALDKNKLPTYSNVQPSPVCLILSFFLFSVLFQPVTIQGLCCLD